MNISETIFSKNFYILLLFFSLLTAVICLHPSIYYNSDAHISSVSLIIADTFFSQKFSFHYLLPGFKANGGFTPYLHWPPITYWLLACWFKVAGNSILSARIFIVIIKIFTDLLFFRLLLNYNIEKKYAFTTALIFCCIPFRMMYVDLIFGDNFIFLLICISMILIQQNNKFVLLLFGVVGILCTWYFGVFCFGILIFSLIKKNNLTSIVLLLAGCLIGVSTWLAYVFFAKQQVDLSHFITIPNKSNGVQYSFLSQFLSYSWWSIFSQQFDYFQVFKWILKFSTEVIVLTISLSIIPMRVKKIIKDALLSWFVGFVFLFIVLPVFFMIHNHNIYFLSFGLALYISSKVNFEFNKLVICLLAITYFFIVKIEHQNLNTKSRDNYLIKEITNNKIENVFIYNGVSINKERFYMPWWVMYETKTMLFERVENLKSIEELFLKAKINPEKSAIFSSIKLENRYKLVNYYNGIYYYKIEKNNF